MRINDEYTFREDLCSLSVILEPYNTKYILSKDVLENHIESDFYSAQLYIDDECDIISIQNIKEEFIVKSSVKFGIILDEKDSLTIEDKVNINIYENGIYINKITI